MGLQISERQAGTAGIDVEDESERNPSGDRSIRSGDPRTEIVAPTDPGATSEVSGVPGRY